MMCPKVGHDASESGFQVVPTFGILLFLFSLPTSHIFISAFSLMTITGQSPSNNQEFHIIAESEAWGGERLENRWELFSMSWRNQRRTESGMWLCWLCLAAAQTIAQLLAHCSAVPDCPPPAVEDILHHAPCFQPLPWHVFNLPHPKWPLLKFQFWPSLQRRRWALICLGFIVCWELLHPLCDVCCFLKNLWLVTIEKCNAGRHGYLDHSLPKAQKFLGPNLHGSLYQNGWEPPC